ncbi:MAG: contractile injection system tape measure protein [Bacteroidota bacterium]
MIHTIRQQYLHISINGTESDGLALQARLSRLCNDWLLPALERVLDRHAPTAGHLYIERLEIDAGTLSMERLEADLAQTVAQAVEKAIREQLSAEAAPTATFSNHVQPKTEVQALEEAFAYFLRTGRLPWSFRLTEGKTFEQAILDSWVADAGFRFGKEALLRTLVTATARKRLLRQFSVHFRDRLLARFAPAARETVENIRKSLYTSGIETTAIERFTNQLTEVALARMAKGETTTEKQLIGDAWHSLPDMGSQGADLKNALERQWPGYTSGTKAHSNHPLSAGKEPPTFQEEPSETVPEAAESKEGIYIDNAGLVLLNPFLPRFFEALGLAGEDKLLHPDRALCLLHYLATGQSVAPEYELMLPKILCNIPLETPVELDITLLEAEKEEATALLKAVIRHWEALRNTTPDGLRGTFLLRPGKLSLRDDGDWLLQVEPQSFDILLDQLPWGISMIKLPWMERMLWVEWSL